MVPSRCGARAGTEAVARSPVQRARLRNAYCLLPIRDAKMQRLLRRAVVAVAILLTGAVGITDGIPRPSEHPDAAVVPLFDPAAMPESAIPVARAAMTSRSAPSLRFPYVPEPEYITSPTNHWAGRDGASIDYIVIHVPDISYACTPRSCNSSASVGCAHYLFHSDGNITQIVAKCEH